MRYAFDVTCPYCGGPLEHRAGGTTTTWTARALTECRTCSAEIVVSVTLHATVDNHRARTPIEHGTERGYQMHRRRGDLGCTPCTVAHNRYTASRLKKAVVPERPQEITA